MIKKENELVNEGFTELEIIALEKQSEIDEENREYQQIEEKKFLRSLFSRYECEATTGAGLEPKAISLPLLLTRGEHTKKGILEKAPKNYPQLTEQKTIIDWISFTCLEVAQVIEDFLNILIPTATILPLGHGTTGYKRAYEISNEGQIIGRIGTGADHGRPLFTLTGVGCKLVDWSAFVYWYRLLNEPKISRIDLALDTFDNSVNHKMIQKMYRKGEFKPLKAPRNPDYKVIAGEYGTTDTTKGINSGRTIYIGNKNSGKILRAYEKGLEQFGKIINRTKTREDRQKLIESIENYTCNNLKQSLPMAKIADWYRLEVQYGNKLRVLTEDLIINRDKYFAGAYPALAKILAETEIAPKFKYKKHNTNIISLLQNMKEQYGKTVATAYMLGMSPQKIFNEISQGVVSQKLIKAGAKNDIKRYYERA